MKESRSYLAYSWAGRHARFVVAALVLLAMTLGLVGALTADTDEPSFEPNGEVFEVDDRAGSILRSSSTISRATFITEAADGGDVLTADAFREWAAASRRVRASSVGGGHLVDRFEIGSGAIVPGVFSIVDAVEGALPSGLVGASETDVKVALARVLAPGSPTSDLAFTLSEQATAPSAAPDRAWSAPAFTTQIVYDSATFATQGDAELWLRDVQAELQSGAVHTDAMGVAIDGDTTFSEAAAQSAPFIFLAVALIILLIAVVHRSYWSAVVVAIGLAATTLAYYGTAALLGLKMGSLLLAFIVPIAMISFGVDFYIHGVGRVREMQLHGDLPPNRAYPAGMAAVFTAMLLAATSSIAAFLANATSGTEAIVQFGLGAAIALAWAYLLLGQVAPRVLLGLEAFVGPNPTKGTSRYVYALVMVLVAVVAGFAVALATVMPAIGTAAVGMLLVALVGVPALATRRRNRRASSRGKQAGPSYRGSAHGLQSAGRAVHALARRRAGTIPVAAAIAVVGLLTALGVRSGFEITDFLAADTDFVRSIDRAAEHFPSSGEGSSYIFVEGDLTDPAALEALDVAVAAIDGSEAGFGRNADGTLIVDLHAADLVRLAMADGETVLTLESSGVDLSDVDGNGIPDSAVGVAALFDRIMATGVPAGGGATALAAAEVSGILADAGGGGQATAIVVQMSSFTDAAVIVEAEAVLHAVATGIEAAAPGLATGVSGEVLTQYHGMDAFTRSMLISVPLAVLLTLLVAAVLLRSVRYAVASVVPIGLVVIGIYAFMAIAGYTVNVVTATIAAIAVGVGIDFSTHFTARYREELSVHEHRLEAVRRAGEGTGGALVLSALTSVLGFMVMAAAPTPIFATFGTLTAVMIALALIVALAVLPSLLVVVTPRTRSERPAEAGELEPERSLAGAR